MKLQEYTYNRRTYTVDYRHDEYGTHHAKCLELLENIPL